MFSTAVPSGARHATVRLHVRQLLGPCFGGLKCIPPLPITRAMSIESTLAQVSAIRQALANPATLISSSAVLSGGTEAPAADGTTGTGEESSFADSLAQASGNYQSTAAPTAALGEPETYSPTGLAGN